MPFLRFGGSAPAPKPAAPKKGGGSESAPPRPAKLVRSGYLVKKHWARTVWKARFFRLFEDRLMFYKRQDSDEALGMVVFDKFTTVERDRFGEADLVFVVANRHGEMYLCATDAVALEQWMADIRTCIEGCFGPTPLDGPTKALMERHRLLREVEDELQGTRQTFTRPISDDVYKTVVAHIVHDDAVAEADARRRREEALRARVAGPEDRASRRAVRADCCVGAESSRLLCVGGSSFSGRTPMARDRAGGSWGSASSFDALYGSSGGTAAGAASAQGAKKSSLKTTDTADDDASTTGGRRSNIDGQQQPKSRQTSPRVARRRLRRGPSPYGPQHQDYLVESGWCGLSCPTFFLDNDDGPVSFFYAEDADAAPSAANVSDTDLSALLER
mmetsp:Transcript_1482/g.5743  ORF Transcript_1482/g.5743 Transcript_1482/m.5743 type:complete len:388 (-) Transcript_1482:335-1498(-)|eukprot:CAMPEP_0185705610 /NCGR_PEP_ID=MMETSP1164-20130828/20218_1 /TAXON_ID=1104430 /ORGANISM="Chrysoreinhardia sp, Strain CCMP2950" /LENGTH=387 /DNA_ID=CAMNT_0028372999 /DNA_START=55 /DNA_END=1218 /DNA_ORIENTATION=-